MTTAEDNIEDILLTDIQVDIDTQIRAVANREAIERYAELMKDESGATKLPPILLYRDEKGTLWLADGFHRTSAAILNEFETIKAIVRKGTRADAVWAAAIANRSNGVPLNKKDLKKGIVMLYEAWPDRSNAMIAEAIGCTEGNVRYHLKQVRKFTDLPEGKANPKRKIIGKDGKSYSVKNTVAKKMQDCDNSTHKKPTQQSDNTKLQPEEPTQQSDYQAPQPEKPTTQPDEPETLPEKTGQQFGLHCRPGEKPGATGKPFVPTTTLKDLRHDNPDILMSQLMAHFPREYTVGLIKSIFRGLFGRSGEEITKPLAQELYQEYGG